MAGRKPGVTPPATVAERQARMREKRRLQLELWEEALREIKDEAPTITRAREIAWQALAAAGIWH